MYVGEINAKRLPGYFLFVPFCSSRKLVGQTGWIAVDLQVEGSAAVRSPEFMPGGSSAQGQPP